MNKLALFMLLLSSAAIFSAPTSTLPLGTVRSAMAQLCGGAKELLPVVAMTMTVVAGIIYAAGQIMGAETRARANVWATAALTGALIGVLIYAIAPAVLTTIYNNGSIDTYTDVAGACI